MKNFNVKFLVAKLKNTNFDKLYASFISIGIGLGLGLILMIITNPLQAFPAFGTILLGGFTGGSIGTGNVLFRAAPLIAVGLSVAFAFKAGLFNIGASGQALFGGFFAIAVAVKWTFLPSGIIWIVAILAAVLAGAFWGAIPGLLKAFFNVSEVIATIMMNYISLYLVTLMIRNDEMIFNVGTSRTVNIPSSSVLPRLWLDKLFPNSSANISILIAIIAAVIIWFILYKTTFGYELRAVGLNRNAAKYAGVNEKTNIISAMAIAGALAGLAGGMMYLSPRGNQILVGSGYLIGEGFTGISIALLATSNPIGVIFTGLFVAYISLGGFYAGIYDFAPEIIDIIVAVIIYCSALSLLIKSWIDKARERKNLKLTESAIVGVSITGEVSENDTLDDLNKHKSKRVTNELNLEKVKTKSKTITQDTEDKE